VGGGPVSIGYGQHQNSGITGLRAADQRGQPLTFVVR